MTDMRLELGDPCAGVILLLRIYTDRVGDALVALRRERTEKEWHGMVPREA